MKCDLCGIDHRNLRPTGPRDRRRLICPVCRRIRGNDSHVRGINPSLHRRARGVALDLGLTVGDIYNRALQHWLENMPGLLTRRDREILANTD